ncbi:MAG: TldD/PmbA family protein [Clostridia bacterium]|nr:TldD/PmbA family protein [Clostridia bacterium]
MEDYGILAKKLVEEATAKGAHQAEVYISKGKELTIEVSKGQVETLKNAEEHGLGIRVFVDQKMGYAYTSDFSPTALTTAVERAIANADKTFADSFNVLPKPVLDHRELDIYDPGIEKTSVDEKIQMALQIEKAAKEYDPRVKIIESCTYQDSQYQVTLASSEGIVTGYHGAYCGCFAYVVAEEEGDAQTGFGLQFELKIADLDPVKVGREAARKAVRMLGAKNINTQKAPVVFDPYVATNFLGVLAPALSAEAVQKGKSLFAGKLGTQVCSPLISIIDDGALPGAIMSAPFDGEGVKTGRTSLIEKGVLKSFLHNSYTAAKEGVTSTGNAVRSFKSTPEVGTTNFFIEAGSVSRDELLSGIDRGFYVTEVMGMHTANPISGDFSVGASGLWIENGKLTKAVRGVAIAGNLMSLFQQVDCVADDLTFFVGRGAPTIRIKEMTISGS